MGLFNRKPKATKRFKTSKTKKPKRSYKSYSGEYGGTSFDLQKRKLSKREYQSLTKTIGRRPKSKIEYVYNDSDVNRRLNKKQYKNLIKNSEVLYNDKAGKYIRL